MEFIDNLSKNETVYRHLEFSRCGKISALSTNIIDRFRKSYQGLFSKGFSQEYLNSISLSNKIIKSNITISFRNDRLLQIKSITENDLKSKYNLINCENSYFQNFERKSVGIAIGHSNLKRIIKSLTDLSIWIN